MNKNSSKSECEPPTKKSKLDLNKSSQAEKEIVIKKDASGIDTFETLFMFLCILYLNWFFNDEYDQYLSFEGHDGNLSVQNKTWINVETEELTIDSPELQPEEVRKLPQAKSLHLKSQS
jgi:hypothetical protein